MGKLAEDLKKGFCHMVEAFTSCKKYRGNGDVKEPKIQSSMKVSIQKRGGQMKLKAPRGPTRPSLPKGPPAQTG